MLRCVSAIVEHSGSAQPRFGVTKQDETTVPSNDTRIFPEARAVLDALLQALDAAAPEAITGAHVIGSIALGDAHPGQSDVDLVLVCNSDTNNAGTMAVLEHVLADLRDVHPQPALDGMVLSNADLVAGPDLIDGPRPIIFDSVPELGEGGSTRNPVTWQTLVQCGIAYRGRSVEPGAIWHDPIRLDRWTRGNLESYWRAWLARIERLGTRQDLASLIAEATEWGVLGVARLHYTVTTGGVTSKTGAGVYGLETFPARWHPVIHEALRIRTAPSVDSRYPGDPWAQYRDMQAFVEMVIDNALAHPRLHHV